MEGSEYKNNAGMGDDWGDEAQGWHGHGGHRRHGRHMKWKQMNIFAKIGLIILGIILAVAAFIGFGFLVVALWNWLMPAIFNLPTISFWQAWGLLVLSSILFKGHGAHRAGSDYRRKSKLRHKMADYQERERQGGETPTAPV